MCYPERSLIEANWTDVPETAKNVNR